MFNVCPDDAIRIKAFRNTEEPPAVSGGYYLRLKKGKEVEIHDWDIVCNYEPELERIFQLKNLIHVATDEEKGLSSYEKSYTRLWEIRGIIDQSFFQGRMTVNFFTAAKDLDMGHIRNRTDFSGKQTMVIRLVLVRTKKWCGNVFGADDMAVDSKCASAK